MQLTEFKDDEIVGDLKKFLAARGFNLKHIIIKSRVKTPYSVFEKIMQLFLPYFQVLYIIYQKNFLKMKFSESKLILKF